MDSRRADVRSQALFAFTYPGLATEDEPTTWRSRRTRALREGAGDGSGSGARGARERVHRCTERVRDGVGPTQHVFLWDTLLNGEFTDDEVRAASPHELGHLSREHVLKSLAWYSPLALPGAYLIAVATSGAAVWPGRRPSRRSSSSSSSRSSHSPVENAISRHFEQEADWIAFETTRKPSAARTLFVKFTTSALQAPDPLVWSVLLLDSHPPVADRSRWRKPGAEGNR